MSVECYPISVMPHPSRIFSDYVESRGALNPRLEGLYAGSPFATEWMRGMDRTLSADRADLCNLLEKQNRWWKASDAVFANIATLRDGARAVVTGQQVGLLGGPLMTMMKAATAIRKAQIATEMGVPHVPVFWMATEDHDLDEINQATLLSSKNAIETLHAEIADARLKPVGNVLLGEGIEAVLAQAEELLAFAPLTEQLRQWYAPGQTFANAFAQWISFVFREFGLIVIDASERGLHALGAPVLRAAIERAEEFEALLLARNEELATRGYHAQVLVQPGASLLFLVNDDGQRLPLRRTSGTWKAGARTYSTEELLAILAAEPERLSPNALLRPVFQDALLPTSAYIAGPAEIAYFAQSEVLFRAILGVMTPVIPRLSATLIEPQIADVMQQHELTYTDALQPVADLAQKLAARAMPMEGKKKLASAGNALDVELKSLLEYMHAIDASLGRSADVSASKMRYQMNRMRRMAANFELQKEASLGKHATAIGNNLFPNGIPQERSIAGAHYVARYGDRVAELLVENAEQECPGHRVLYL